MADKLRSNKYRFLGGVNSVGESNPLGQLERLDPTKYAKWMEDFIAIESGITNSEWTHTNTNGTLAVVGPTGVVTLTMAGGDNDLSQLYLTNAPFQTNSKKLWFECRCKVAKGSGGTIGQEEVAIGLSSVQTAGNFFAADGTSRAMDDFIGFLSYDGDANIDIAMGENDVFSTETAVTTYVDDTWMVLSVYYDNSTAYFYKDDAEVGRLSTNEPTSVVTPMMYIKAGEAKAKVLHVDYILVIAER
jgi:hypothetical protein